MSDLVARADTTDALRVAVSSDGTVAAVLYADRVVIARLPTLEPVGEVGLDVSLPSHDITFALQPPHLVILSATRVYVVAIEGPTVVSKLDVPGPSRLFALSGDHALVVGRGGASLVHISSAELSLAPLTRNPIVAAGALGAGRMIACTGGVLEEWDLRAAAPTRRIRLDRPVIASHVGGDERRVWVITQAEPDLVTLVPLQSDRSPRRITLPSPIVRASLDPTGDLLAVVTAYGSAYVVDLSGDGAPVSLERPGARDVAWTQGSLVLVVTDHAVELVSLALVGAPSAPVRERTGDIAKPVHAAMPAPPPAGELSGWERLNAWRDRLRAPVASTSSRELRAPNMLTRDEPRGAPGWREAIAGWARRTISGSLGEAPIDLGHLEEICARLSLDVGQARAVALVYGARLCGLHEVAPIDVARVAGWRWDEALGHGRLASLGIVRWRRGQLRLARVMAAVLDMSPPYTGKLVGSAPVLLDGGAVIAPPTVEIDALAVWAASLVGQLLTPRSTADPLTFALEAHLRGVPPLLPHAWLARLRERPKDAVVVVDDPHVAAELGLAVVGAWPT